MEPEVDLDSIIAQHSILGACSEKTLATIRRQAHLRSFEAGAVLYKEGEAAQVALIALSGVLQISKTSRGGRCQVLCNMRSDSCGGLCLLTMADECLADIRGLEPGYMLVLERATLQKLAFTDRVLYESAWHATFGCLTHLSGLVETLSFNKVSRRVALMLLENTEQSGDWVRRTQAQIAAEVGTTREVVARSLADLQGTGAIKLGRGRVAVLDRERLSEET